MNTTSLNLLLADDDADDCMIFKEALEELPISSSLETVSNGDELMDMLSAKSTTLPDIVFLDLNMPRKNGLECLSEIKVNEKLKTLPVIVYSTSLDHEVIHQLYEKGAHRYIRKPGDFSKLKKVIFKALNTTSKNNSLKPSREHFVIQA